LRPPCGNVCDCAFQNLQQSLLHAFTRKTSRVIEGFSSLRQNLIDFVDVDYALLRAFDVAVRGLQKFDK